MQRPHENEVAFDVIHQTKHWTRSAILRFTAGSVYLVAAGIGHAMPLTYAGAAFATMTSLACLISAAHEEGEGEGEANRGLIATLLQNTTFGRRVVNTGGVLEGVGVLLLAVGLYGFPGGDLAALAALVATISYFGSFGMNVFADPSFYRPLPQGPVSPWQRALTLLRQSIGVLMAAVAAGVTVWAIEPHLRLVALAICVSLVTVGVRVRELDRYLATADQVAGHRVEVAHLVMGEDLHGEVNTTIAGLKKLAQSGKADNAVVLDTTLQLEHALREMIYHQTHREGTLDSTATLKGWLDKFATTNRCVVHFDAPDVALDTDTRRIARQVIEGLVVNAAAAAAKKIAVTLQRHDNTWTVTVTDDGAPIDSRYWMRDGGGVQRLRALLKQRGGDLTKRDGSPDGTPKTVTAHWTKMNEKE